MEYECPHFPPPGAWANRAASSSPALPPPPPSPPPPPPCFDLLARISLEPPATRISSFLLRRHVGSLRRLALPNLRQPRMGIQGRVPMRHAASHAPRRCTAGCARRKRTPRRTRGRTQRRTSRRCGFVVIAAPPSLLHPIVVRPTSA